MQRVRGSELRLHDAKTVPGRVRSGSRATRVVIASEDEIFRRGLGALLRSESDMKVVGDDATPDDIRGFLRRTRADVALIDIREAREAAPAIPRLALLSRVLIICDSEDPDELSTLVQAGASGVLLRRSTLRDTIAAIRQVARGAIWLTPHLHGALASWLRQGPERQLTRREIEVVRCVARGFRNSEIASVLCISEDTVKTHLHHIFQKLEVRERVGVALHAIRSGLVRVHDQSLPSRSIPR